MSLPKGTLDELRINRERPADQRNWFWPLVGVVLFCVLGLFLTWWFTRPKTAEVRTLTVAESGSAAEKTVLNASGYVTARRQATVSSKVTGKVMEVLIEEGQKVEAGQVLARLDDTNVKASWELAQAQLHASQALQEETRVRLAEAQLELRRVSDLVKNKISTASDLDRAQAQADSYQARLKQQQAEVLVAERQVALWQQQVDDTIIRAPFAGIVVTKNAQPGEMISPVSAGGGFTRTGIGTIVDMSSLEIEVDVNESFINRVQSGQPVVATLDSYPDGQIPSKVIAIIPTADRQKATVKVRIAFDALDPRILPDMGVKVAFHGMAGVTTARRGMVVPKSAIRQQGGREIVLVVKEGKIERRAVKLGAARGDEVPVLAGLESGEKIVVQGPDTLAEGQKVKEVR